MLSWAVSHLTVVLDAVLQPLLLEAAVETAPDDLKSRQENLNQ